MTHQTVAGKEIVRFLVHRREAEQRKEKLATMNPTPNELLGSDSASQSTSVEIQQVL